MKASNPLHPRVLFRRRHVERLIVQPCLVRSRVHMSMIHWTNRGFDACAYRLMPVWVRVGCL